jgi:hypothetical protein
MDEGGHNDTTETLWEEMDVPLIENRVPKAFIEWYIEHTQHMGFDFSADKSIHVRYIRKDAVQPPKHFRKTEKTGQDKDEAEVVLQRLRRKAAREKAIKRKVGSS